MGMERDFLDVNQKTEEHLRAEREAWAAREASIVFLSVFEQFRSSELMECYPECRELGRAIAQKALLKGYEFGHDHGYAAQRMIARAPQATDENAVEAVVFRWLSANPALDVLTICERLSRDGYQLPTYMAWAGKLSRYAARMQQSTNNKIDPWLVWQGAAGEKKLRAGLDAWVSEMRHKAKCILGAKKLTKASKDCVMPKTPIWGEYITKEPVPWHQEPEQTADDAPWPDE
jgi:hypothetical protein